MTAGRAIVSLCLLWAAGCGPALAHVLTQAAPVAYACIEGLACGASATGAGVGVTQLASKTTAGAVALSSVAPTRTPAPLVPVIY